MPERAVEARRLDLIDDDPVSGAQRIQSFAGDIANDAHGQPWTGKRLAMDHVVRQPQLRADGSDLILEQVAQRLDQLEA